MKTRRFILKSEYDSLPISVVAVMPDDARACMVMQLSHGMCGCKERFLPFMEYMAENGVVCVANDHRGHGESIISVDDLGYMYDGGSSALVEDMAQVTSWIHKIYPEASVFLLGHSMGAMAARAYAKKHDELIDGLILCGNPAWNPFSKIAHTLTGALAFLGGGHIRPTFISDMMSGIYNRRFASEGTRAWTCSDPEVRRSFDENPHCNFVFTVNGMHNLLGLMIASYDNDGWQMHNPSMPVLFLSGGDDPCMKSESDFHAAPQAMCRHGYSNVSSALYGGMRHEILNEKEKENVWKDILLFIKSYMSIRSLT